MGTRRPWVVYPGFSSGRHQTVTFDNTGTGIPARSFATYDAAHAAAMKMVLGDPEQDGQYFAAARLGYSAHPRPDGWDVCTVHEYLPLPDGAVVRRRDSWVDGDWTEILRVFTHPSQYREAV